MLDQPVKKSEEKKSCPNCGAELKYKPGSDQLKCEYCGYEEFIEKAKSSFEELELKNYLDVVGSKAYTETISMLHCKNCGANQHVEENYKSLHCVYCGEPLIIEDVLNEDWILPGALIPFKLDNKKARQIFLDWVRNIWFVPNKLKRAALNPEGLHGVYVPYWTFDCNLFAAYEGMRGDYYYITRTVQTSNGPKQIKERKTRWTPAFGQVSGFIDDILINASKRKSIVIPSRISHWNYKELVPFNQKYLSGFVTEKYTLSLKDAHHLSFQEAKENAYGWIRNDIGGDIQRINHTDIRLSDETFKHILLPIYISTYFYSGKEYHFYVNGQTGSIYGNYPLSFWKIFFLVLFVAIILLMVLILSK
ncbi:DNA helicase PriA [Abyssalbus ytuae]|uniref:DNA helicase PriA n=1 Tax=Abyssalbus ytuae TaxID=2926907 RepID=A0A9E7D3E1_9FLAO|nr:DNA helicase PriA [Abyssalbus ytuae]UOB19208.1 DNA helicase PriA [Abyssalbus ytuae]